MAMDQRFTEFYNSMYGFKSDDDTLLPNLDQPRNQDNTFKLKDDSVDLSFMDIPSLSPNPDLSYFTSTPEISSERDSPGDSDSSDDVLKFINSILMEENIDQQPSMFHDPLALQATERCLYDAIGEKYPSSPNQPPLYFNQNAESPDYFVFSSSAEPSNSSNSNGNSVDSQWTFNPREHNPSVQSYPYEYQFGSPNCFNDDVNGRMGSSMTSHLVSSIFSDSQSILQFKRGVEEASKFLPNSNQFIIDLESYKLPPQSKKGASEVVIKAEKDEREGSPNGLRGRKNHHREEITSAEERSSKQLAVYVEEEELSEKFDHLLLLKPVKGEPLCCGSSDDEEGQSDVTEKSQQSGKTRAKKQGNTQEVDLRSLLISCAQSVAADDRRTANEQLKRIRQHSSPSGDGTQRLAHIFADSLEARLAGTGSHIYTALASRRISATEKLKAFQVYLPACPFKKMSVLFTVKMIWDLAEKSSKKKLHIIDFGIQYGFQWPVLLQFLTELPGGAPELRITGIEFPRPGFRPAEFVEETGRRLAKYCERFNVPFRYHGIAQKWETIKIEDLNLCSDELLAVSCQFRFEHLLDETVLEDSPRDAVLKLIRKMKPDIFTHSVVNGSYNAPFFVTRFREALFYYSSLLDMFDISLDREDQDRMNFEKEFYGREVMNVVACEGSQRVERPETYKQWQARHMRAGFRMLPLDQELVKKLRGKVKAWYHKDFVIDEDGRWLLQGWKGRIFCASSCWIPA